MQVMKVVEVFNKVEFEVAHPDVSDGTSFLAVQLVDRMMYPGRAEVFANTTVEVGDLVLVAEVEHFLYEPNDSERNATEAVNHIIVGLIPPSNVQEIKNYSNLVR